MRARERERYSLLAPCSAATLKKTSSTRTHNRKRKQKKKNGERRAHASSRTEKLTKTKKGATKIERARKEGAQARTHTTTTQPTKKGEKKEGKVDQHIHTKNIEGRRRKRRGGVGSTRDRLSERKKSKPRKSDGRRHQHVALKVTTQKKIPEQKTNEDTKKK